ncbi:hypothetical protein Rt10032_c27g6823 [Rhodotorula toruloides]|uniref:Uncharacterized protein n=1 Tax=Rhodotorula toruloides TaxID=5286 RepID=A0A511KSC9_RHOTO|nr:hypothetical protein Rt10032_c27g6823 [Rhodotorula toruloides]
MNNPFAKPPQTEVSSAAHRFPDVWHTDPDLQPQQQAYYGQAQGQGGVDPQHTGRFAGTGTSGYMGYLQPPPQSPMGGGAVYSPGGMQQPQYTGMHPYPPQQQLSYSPAPPPPVSDLDPYSSLSSSSFASPSPSPASSQQQAGSLLSVPQTHSHPRDYVQENRAQLMSWDEYAWRQLDNRIDALREAWQTRLALLRAASDQGADPVKTEQLRKEGEGFVDSIHAAKVQLGEVKAGWRHSTDLASKSRVREALNAGLSSLPPHPTPLPPSALGGSFALSATKQHILSQYNPPQQQQMTQGQMTGMGAVGFYGQQVGYYGGGGGGVVPQQTGYAGGMGGIMPQQTGYGGGYGGYGTGGAPGPGGYY